MSLLQVARQLLSRHQPHPPHSRVSQLGRLGCWATIASPMLCGVIGHDSGATSGRGHVFSAFAAALVDAPSGLAKEKGALSARGRNRIDAGCHTTFAETRAYKHICSRDICQSDFNCSLLPSTTSLLLFARGTAVTRPCLASCQ